MANAASTDSTAPAETDRSPVPAVTRAAGILDLLARQGRLPMIEIARATGLAKSSTLNLLVALEQADLVHKDTEGYALGRATVELGAAYVRSFNLVREFYRLSDQDPRLSHELLHLAVLQGTDVLYLARHDGAHHLRLSANVGDRFPASITAVGNILLAQFDDDQVRAMYDSPERLPVWTPRSVSSIEQLLEKLHATRERGYAIDDRETNAGTYGMAVLLPAQRPGEEPFALGTSIVHHTSTPQQREGMLRHLLLVQEGLTAPQALARAGRDEGRDPAITGAAAPR